MPQIGQLPGSERTISGCIGHVHRVAGFVSEVVLRNKRVGEAVTRERQRFLQMRYCVPAEKALPLAAGVLTSILPGGVMEWIAFNRMFMTT